MTGEKLKFSNLESKTSQFYQSLGGEIVIWLSYY